MADVKLNNDQDRAEYLQCMASAASLLTDSEKTVNRPEEVTLIVMRRADDLYRAFLVRCGRR